MTEVKSKLLKGGRVSVEHFVEFEDGDKEWLNLVEKETMGHLQWPAATKAKEMVSPSPIKKVKLEDTKPPAAKKMEAASPAKKVKLEDTKPAAAELAQKEGEESGGSEDSAADGDEGEEEDSVDDDSFVLPDPPPKTLDAIVRLMDELEPDVKAKTGETYFARQADNRGGCSITRGKLRKLARAHPDHPAVRHWMETSKWQPPDAATLRAMMDLIKAWHNK